MVQWQRDDFADNQKDRNSPRFRAAAGLCLPLDGDRGGPRPHGRLSGPAGLSNFPSRPGSGNACRASGRSGPMSGVPMGRHCGELTNARRYCAPAAACAPAAERSSACHCPVCYPPSHPLPCAPVRLGLTGLLLLLSLTFLSPVHLALPLFCLGVAATHKGRRGVCRTPTPGERDIFTHPLPG